MAESYTVAFNDPKIRKRLRCKAPFGYYGAKSRIREQIVKSLPPHNAWVEAFCGSCAVTFAKPVAPIEVVNDADGLIVNVFRQLRDNTEELCRQVALTPYSRHEWKLARQRNTDATPLEKAREFLIATMMTVNGTFGNTGSGFSFSQSYAREGKEARVSRWYNLPERLAAVVERLRCVRIENRDARELVAMFSSRPATLMYLDPPYFVKREHEYVIDANNQDFHVELLEACASANCMILISGYENELYGRMLTRNNGWTKASIDTHTRDTKGSMYGKTEVLWMNRQFAQAQKAKKVPIELTAKEIKENKVNPSRA